MSNAFSSVDPSAEMHGSSPDPALAKLVEAVTRSQSNYRELIDNLDQAVFTLSAEGEVRVANRLFAQILGVPFHDLIGHPLSEFVSQPSWEEARRLLPRLIEMGSWTGVAKLQLVREQTPRFFNCWLQPILDNGGLGSVIGWARDITAQRNRERTFTDLFESLHEGVFVTTPEGQVLDVNLALVRMLGYASTAEMLKLNVRDLYATPAERDEIVRMVGELGAVIDREVQYVRKDGKRIWCSFRGYAVRDASGRLLRLHGLLTDVTQRHEFEKRLRDEQQFVRRLIDSHPDAVLVVDPSGEFVYANKSISEITGTDPASFIGSQIGAELHPDDAARVRAFFKHFLTPHPERNDIEFQARNADGTSRSFRTTVAPMKDDAGNVTAVIAATRDITEKRHAEKLLVEKEKSAVMGRMLANAAHELNNPLTAILGVTDLLRERAVDDAMRRHIDLVLQQARRAAGIVQGLLALSRHSSQSWTEVQIPDLLRQLAQVKKPLLAEKKIEITVSCPPGLPPILADSKLLAQVFQNIVTNSEQAILASRGTGAITISVESEGDFLRISFVDDGPGIAPENAGKIFDPFFTTKRPGGGSGLGLTIALAVVKEHGGDIRLASVPVGAGTCVQVFLPVAGAESQVVPINTASQQGGLPGLDLLKGRSVLVVDDEESIREIACEALSARGMVVSEAGTAEEALRFIRAKKCEVVLCDFNLPDLKGEELLERVRSLRRGELPRFIFMTGELVDAETVARFAKVGAMVLQKPFPVSTLASLLVENFQSQTPRSR